MTTDPRNRHPLDARDDTRAHQSDVFLAFNNDDRVVVQQLAELLEQRGFDVWYDEWRLVPGQIWQEAIEQALAATKAAIVCIGPHAQGPWQEPERWVLLSQAVRHRIPIVPLLLPTATALDLPLLLQPFTLSDCRDGFSERRLRRLSEGLRRTDAPRRRRCALRRRIPAEIARRPSPPWSWRSLLSRFSLRPGIGCSAGCVVAGDGLDK